MLDIMLQTFEDLRRASAAATSDDDKLESALSTAEQIGAVEDAILHSTSSATAPSRAHALARSMVGTLVRRIPEDVSVMNKFWHAVVEKHAKKNGGAWGEFLDGGKEAMSLLT
jgi:hypothetical protein